MAFPSWTISPFQPPPFWQRVAITTTVFSPKNPCVLLDYSVYSARWRSPSSPNFGCFRTPRAVDPFVRCRCNPWEGRHAMRPCWRQAGTSRRTAGPRSSALGVPPWRPRKLFGSSCTRSQAPGWSSWLSRDALVHEKHKLWWWTCQFSTSAAGIIGRTMCWLSWSKGGTASPHVVHEWWGDLLTRPSW